MKFGKYLATRQLDLPEYADYFINYKQLKKLINRLAGPDPKAAHENLQAHKATFFFQLERELEKVQTCYQEKESSLEARLTTLTNRLAAAKKQGISLNSAAYMGLHEGLLRFRSDMERLEVFVELNGTGFSKVLKKWDKRSRSQTKELFLRRAVEIQPMFNRETLGNMTDQANKQYIELEALHRGDTVYEPSTQALILNPSDELLGEFNNFAEHYDPNDRNCISQMKEWRQQLTACSPPQISTAFRQAIHTAATDDALLDLYGDGDIKLYEVDEYTGKSVLHYAAACKNGRTRIIKLALEHNVDVNLQDQYGKTALHYAVINKRHDVVLVLIDAGANVDSLDMENYAPLHYALYFNLHGIFKTLVDNGARVNGNSERDYIALNFACRYGAGDCIEIYLDKFPRPDMIADAEGLYPLHIVARAGFYHLVKPLVAAGANVDALDKLNSWTPLMYAAAAGNSKTVRELLESNANWSLLDERGYSAFFYACWRGHARSIPLLAEKLPQGTTDISRAANMMETGDAAGTSAQPSATVDDDDMEFDIEDDEDLDLDGIPALSLPPPFIPIQRYGHSFLDSKKVVVQIVFDPESKPSIRFKEDRKLLTAGRLVMSTSSSRDSITRNIDLPISEHQQVQTFQVDDLDKFVIDFDILPTFGTRVMVKASAHQGIFYRNHNRRTTLPLLNMLLQPIGELSFNYLVVMPYSGNSLEITNYDTYSKSTSYINSDDVAYPRDHYHATNTVEAAQIASYSVVTSTSLNGVYHRVPIILTSDLVVLVSEPTRPIHGVEIPLNNLKAADCKKLFPEIKTLEEYLEDESSPSQLNIYITYPTDLEANFPDCPFSLVHGFNETADGVLHVVFAHVRKHHGTPGAKKFMFSSPNSDVCTVMNWKQPNFPVLFVMNGLNFDGSYSSANRYRTYTVGDMVSPINFSANEAARFASQTNLMGVVMPGKLLQLAPAIVQAIRVLGLVVIADSAATGDIQGVDGICDASSMTFFNTQNAL